MKKNLIMLCGWVAMTFAACTNDDLPIVIEQPNQAGEEVSVTAYAAGDDTPDSRISSTYDGTNKKYTFTWDNNDTFSVIRDGVNQTFTKTNGGENEFSGVKPGSTGDFYAIYPKTTATSHTMATFDISTQTNNAAYVMYATSADGDVYHFKHAMSFLRFTLPEGLDGTTFDITITTPTGVFTTGIINLTDGSISYDGSIKNTISLKNRTANGAILVAIPPMPAGSNKRLSFWVKSNSGKYYEGTLNGNSENPIKAGKYYTASLSLTETIPYLTFSAVSEQTLDLVQTYYEFDEEYFPYPYPGYGGDTGVIEYSVGNSNTWTQFKLDTDPVTFGGEKGNLRLRGKSPKGTLQAQIVFGDKNTSVACFGDIRTLVDWENHKTADTSSAIFQGLFSGCSVLKSAPELPAINLAENCYQSMFAGCTSLTEAPELPATNLAETCYAQMFAGCTNLTEAPVLKAKTLVDCCYNAMFYGCSALNNITMLATDISADRCLTSWVSGVSATGTFFKNANATWNVTGTSGIPSDWTVENYTGL